MKIFWKRKNQKNSRGGIASIETMTKGKKRNRDEGDVIEENDSSSLLEKNSSITTSTKWFLWYTLVKVNLEQIDCCRRLSELLGISINHVNQAGIKDRRGCTIQKGCLLIDTKDLKLLKSLNLLKNQTEEESLQNPAEFNISAMRTLSFVQEKLLAINIPNFKLFLESGTFDRGYVLPQTTSDPMTTTPAAVIEIGMALGDLEFKETGISPGDLKGNRFNILLRDVHVQEIHPNENESDVCDGINALDLIKERLLTLQQYGFPNFFGTQRMGIISVNTMDTPSPIGPIIGKYLLQNNATGAVYCILSGLDGGKEIIFPTRLSEHSSETTEAMDLEDNEDEEVIDDVEDSAPILQARTLFLSGASLSKVLQLIPQSSTRERKLLKNLIRFAPQPLPQRDPTIPLSELWEEACRCAIRGLPYTTKQLWLSSYQSWLWNHVVDYHLGMNPNRPSSSTLPIPLTVGDILSLDEQKSSLPSLKLVSVDDRGDSERDILHLQQFVVLPMIGKGWTQYPENHVGRFVLLSLSLSLTHSL
jgi:tRNA(Glu) U13 pseudouridine synthase TruD